MVQVGEQAPDFTLLSDKGDEVSLNQFHGKKVVLYFYPRDGTPGCTKEACNIRDNYRELLKYGHIIGISTDSVESHQKFTDKFSLPFPLLSDPDKKIVRSYKVWSKKKFMGKEFMGTHRVTYIIDKNAKIVNVYPKVKSGTHAEELIQDLKQLI